MPIKLRKPPGKAGDLVREGVCEILSQRDASYPSDSLRFDRLHYALPHPIYYAGIQSLVKRKLISHAKISGWRYLILQGNKAVFTARLSLGRNRKLEFGHLSNASYSTATIRALERTAKLPQFRSRNFELRQLEIPGLGVVALWFHGSHSEQFMPLPPVLRMLKPYRLHTQRELISALRQIATRRVGITDARA